SESDAILFYLAEGTPFLPAERFARADVLRWMFFEQYSHEPYIAVARAWLHVFTGRQVEPDRLREKMEGGYRALDVMERHLADRRFFVAERYTIADIALYAYTHVAHEGDFHLGRYPHIRTWLANVAWQVGDVLPLPYPDGAFSLVVSRFAFHHFPEPRAVLAEMKRVCAPGGRVVLVDVAASEDTAKAAAFNRMEKLRDPSHVRALTLAELEGLFAEVGLSAPRAKFYQL